MTPILIIILWFSSGYLAPIWFEKQTKGKVKGAILIQSIFGAICGFITVFVIALSYSAYWWDSDEGKAFRNKEFF